ncbi:MAG: hypothetical protein DME53_10000 [Verrucomicrobia bacterium]|nr:MAG: hypothetical protein DME53_10000 [Verrucomicrobiota bacterium]
MRAPQFPTSCFHHFSCERAFIQMVPQVFSRKFVRAHCFGVRSEDTKMIAVEHFEALDFPALPVLDFGPEADRYASHTKIQIRQLGQRLAVAVALFDYHSPPAAHLLRSRIDL